MNRITAVFLAALLLSSPLPAIADDSGVNQEIRVLSLRDVEQYLWKASTLEEEWRDLEYRQQWVMSELIDICYGLAETKAAMMEAANWNQERKLERQYLALKVEEAQLWDEFERLEE